MSSRILSPFTSADLIDRCCDPPRNRRNAQCHVAQVEIDTDQGVWTWRIDGEVNISVTVEIGRMDRPASALH